MGCCRLAELHRTDPVAHAEAGHHGLGQFGHPFQIVGGAGRRLLEDDLFGGTSGQQSGQFVFIFGPALERAIFLRNRHDIAERLAAADDGDLADDVGMVQASP